MKISLIIINVLVDSCRYIIVVKDKLQIKRQHCIIVHLDGRFRVSFTRC